jgi:hypothetical protein
LPFAPPPAVLAPHPARTSVTISNAARLTNGVRGDLNTATRAHGNTRSPLVAEVCCNDSGGGCPARPRY